MVVIMINRDRLGGSASVFAPERVHENHKRDAAEDDG
jgi:hypothetical protein